MRSRGRLLINAARCTACGAVARSASCHDLVFCGCGGLAVDGGDEYRRVIQAARAGVAEDLSVWTEDLALQGDEADAFWERRPTWWRREAETMARA